VLLVARSRAGDRCRRSPAAGFDNAWRESSLGAPTDIAELQQRIISLDQGLASRTMQLAARDDDLDAARSANMTLAPRN